MLKLGTSCKHEHNADNGFQMEPQGGNRDSTTWRIPTGCLKMTVREVFDTIVLTITNECQDSISVMTTAWLAMIDTGKCRDEWITGYVRRRTVLNLLTFRIGGGGGVVELYYSMLVPWIDPEFITIIPNESKVVYVTGVSSPSQTISPYLYLRIPYWKFDTTIQQYSKLSGDTIYLELYRTALRENGLIRNCLTGYLPLGSRERPTTEADSKLVRELSSKIYTLAHCALVRDADSIRLSPQRLPDK